MKTTDQLVQLYRGAAGVTLTPNQELRQIQAYLKESGSYDPDSSIGDQVVRILKHASTNMEMMEVAIAAGGARLVKLESVLEATNEHLIDEGPCDGTEFDKGYCESTSCTYCALARAADGVGS